MILLCISGCILVSVYLSEGVSTEVRVLNLDGGGREMFKKMVSRGMTEPAEDKIKRLKETLENADAIVIGAGAGLSTSAGFTYSGERFEKYFRDFRDRFGISDMYSGGFYPFPDMETYWAWWSRHIWVNRYMKAPKPVYENLLELVKDKDYFFLSTDVDHMPQRVGFEKKRLFYTQGDYGLLQCSRPCHRKTYDNKEIIEQMVRAQGYEIDKEGELILPEGVTS